jgi:hypothetical protein
MFGKKIGLKLNPGWNYVEVYSDKAKLYSVNSSYIFLKKKYYVTFSNALVGEYYILTVHDSFF